MGSSIVLFLNIGGQEGIIIIFAILLLFGGKKLPELARGLGKGIREFKDASDDVKREIHRNINSIEESVNTETQVATQTVTTTDQSQIEGAGQEVAEYSSDHTDYGYDYDQAAYEGSVGYEYENGEVSYNKEEEVVYNDDPAIREPATQSQDQEVPDKDIKNT